MTPHLTLAVIVRDEAPALRDLLASTRDLWDECVVVDTGSRDDSAAAAREAGAVVVPHAWRDDFAAARNAGLARARGRWILVLDCDERLAPDARARIRRACRAPCDRVYALPQWNYTTRRDLPDARPVPRDAPFSGGAEVYVVAHQIRLFPRQDGLVYTGCIHESVDASAVALGLAVHELAAPVHHYGHLPDWEVRKSRNSLYGRLLRRKIRHCSQDPLARYELAVQLANEGRLDPAERVLALTVRDAPGAPGVHRARLLLARLLDARGQRGRAARQTAHAVHERPDQPACWVAAVAQHHAAGLTEAARRYLRAGRRLFPHEPALRDWKDQDISSGADHGGERCGAPAHAAP